MWNTSLKTKRFEIEPHGGKLINRIVPENRREMWSEISNELEKIELDDRQLSDLEMISVGSFSPLKGFMCSDDYLNVLENMRLADDTVWTLPIVLGVSINDAKNFKEGDTVALTKAGTFYGILHVEEKYSYNKKIEAMQVYKTINPEHPALQNNLYKRGDVLVGGKVKMIKRIETKKFNEYRHDPSELRIIFKEREWDRIVAFQTRNPSHLAHEYLQKCAMETVDGLLIHQTIGWTKDDDLPPEVRIKCYEELIKNYFPKNRVMLSVLPTYMRYAGPREAVFHAIVRKNYGCTHIIIGRDHAGVGDYYDPYNAHKIFNNFEEEEIMITPMMFEDAFYCKKCGHMATKKTCLHEDKHKISLSGTKVRKMLREGKCPPKEVTRPETSKILMDYFEKKRNQ